jgi:thiamine biosynthesis lipoprotein
MGTTYHIKCWGAATADAVVQRAIDDLLERFDRQMSTYRADSELSRFNQAEAKAWHPVSAELAHVVSQAIDFHKLTEGALDVTVAPLVKAWGFGPGSQKSRREPSIVPSPQEIQSALVHVGTRFIQARQDPPALRKSDGDVEIDLSSIAPGYAVDLLLAQLEKLDFKNAMVEIGGEVRGLGHRPDGSPWRVGVEQAGAPGAALVRIVALDDRALTTAGDYHNFSGNRKSAHTHIIDPRNGQALPMRGVAVSVLADTCIEADALDTALLVMGADDGYQWCVEHDVAALFQDGSEPGRLRATPRFEQLVGGDSQPGE